MKVFEASDYSTENLTKFLERQTRKQGVFKKENLETLVRVKILYRPFRRILWKAEKVIGSEKLTSISFVDEELSAVISDSDHRFLLWRPRYANLSITDIEEYDGEYIDCENTEAVQQLISDLILHRWNGQELDEELRPKLRSLQADPLSAIMLIIPRTPYSLRREETILADRKEIHSFVLASSLITNCNPKDILVEGEIGERVFVRTIAAEYGDISSDKTRLLLLETPGTKSLHEAMKSGMALTRIYDLYPECKNIFT